MTQNKNKDRLIRPNEVAELLGVSVQTVHRYAKNNPDFPQKHKIGERAVGFRWHDIKRFIEGGR